VQVLLLFTGEADLLDVPEIAELKIAEPARALMLFGSVGY
jgi:hypothetical protein